MSDSFFFAIIFSFIFHSPCTFFVIKSQVSKTHLSWEFSKTRENSLTNFHCFLCNSTPIWDNSDSSVRIFRFRFSPTRHPNHLRRSHPNRSAKGLELALRLLLLRLSKIFLLVVLYVQLLIVTSFSVNLKIKQFIVMPRTESIPANNARNPPL